MFIHAHIPNVLRQSNHTNINNSFLPLIEILFIEEVLKKTAPIRGKIFAKCIIYNTVFNISSTDLVFLWCFSLLSTFCASVIYDLESGLVHFARCKIVEIFRVTHNEIMCLPCTVIAFFSLLTKFLY